MPYRRAIFPLVKAYAWVVSRLRPDITEAYKTQRALEDATGKITIPSPRCKIEDISCELSDGHMLPLRMFTPLDIGFSPNSGLARTAEYKGTILFIHGGGFANGDIEFYTDACRMLATKLERRIVSVDYRRSPENPFPTAPADCFEVAKLLFTGKIIEDIDPKTITLMGDSAGGTLTSVVSLMARDSGAFSPQNQILLYPLTYYDHSTSSPFPSVIENGENYILTREEIEGYINMYIRYPKDRFDPYFAPLNSLDLSDQPRTLVISAEYCPLRDEGEVYAFALKHAGAEVECVRMLDAIHGYLLYPSFFSVVRDTIGVIKSFLDGDEIRNDEKTWISLLGTD